MVVEEVFAAVSLREVVEMATVGPPAPPPISFLNIDTQGLDVALVLSVSKNLLSYIGKIQLECQDLGPMGWVYEPYSEKHLQQAGPYRIPKNTYNSISIPNDCSTAEKHLQQAGFRTQREVNSCCTQQFNLLAVREESSI